MKEKDKKFSNNYVKIVLFMKESDFGGVNTKLEVRETKENIEVTFENQRTFSGLLTLKRNTEK